MFEFSRDLMRLLHVDGPRDGLTGGDPTLLEVMDLATLRAEGRACDVAAGRVGAKDRPQRHLEAAQVWREIARRTADAAALRKAAAAADHAAGGFGRYVRPKAWARARCEQAFCALLAVDLFGDEGLRAAADRALREAEIVFGAEPAGTAAAFGRLCVQSQALSVEGDRDAVLAFAAQFDSLIERLGPRRRIRGASRLQTIDIRRVRAELLATAGARLKDSLLLRMAVDGLGHCAQGLDPAFEPLARTRAVIGLSTARASLSALDGEAAGIAQAIDELNSVSQALSRYDSPMDWARTQAALAAALQLLAEAADAPRSFDRALEGYDQAMGVLEPISGLVERATVSYQRAVCIARRAEVRGDLAALAKAEDVLRSELATINPNGDPVGWALRQLNFARLYEARAALAGPDRRDQAAAAEALSAALEVFGEHGLRSLSATAARELERLRSMATPAG